MQDHISNTTVLTDLAHTCGNITYNILQHMKSQFPNNYFKSDHISTKIALRDFSRIKDKFSFLSLKKEKPIISVIPKLDTQLPDYGINAVRRLYGSDLYLPHSISYQDCKFFYYTGDDVKLLIDFGLERQKMSFEFSYIVETEYQQYNLYGWMTNKMRINHPYRFPIYLETEVPNNVIKQLSDDIHMPITTHDEIDKFVKFINSRSRSLLKYKYKTATGNYKFFMINKINVDLLMDGSPSMNDGDREGMTTDNFMITQTVIAEFSYPNAFYYISTNTQDHIEIEDGDLNENKIKPTITIENQLIEVESSKGYDYYIAMEYEVDNNIKDILDVHSLFDKDIIHIIEDAKANNIQLNNLFEVLIYKDINKLEEDIEYEIDWEHYNLITYNCDTSYKYKVFLFINRGYLNDITDSIHEY